MDYWVSLLFAITSYGLRSPSGFGLGICRKLLVAEKVSNRTLRQNAITNDGRLHIDSILPRGVILGHRSEFTYICYSLNR